MNVRRERIATALVFLGYGIAAGAWAANIPLLKAHFDLAELQLGLALLGVATGGMCGMFLVRLAIARTGAGFSARLCVAAQIALFCMPALAASRCGLAFFVFAFGLVNGALNVAINTHAGLVQKQLRRPTMSLFHATFSSGCLAGALLAGMAAHWRVGFAPSLFFIDVLLALILMVAARFGLGFQPAAASVPSLRLALPDRRLATLAGLAFLCVMTEGAVADWSAVYMQTLGAGSQMGLAYACFALAMAIGRFAGDATVHHLGWLIVATAGSALAAVGFAVAISLPIPAMVAGGFFLVGLGLANVMPLLFGAAGRLAADNPARGVATAGIAGSLGGVLGPSIIGSLAQYGGIRVALIVLIGTTVTLSISTWRLIDWPND